MDIYTRIGAKICKLRRERGWTQADLASKVGVFQNTISRWETAEYHIDLEQLQSLADAFGIPIATLFRDESEPSSIRFALNTELDGIPDQELAEIQTFIQWIRFRLRMSGL